MLRAFAQEKEDWVEKFKSKFSQLPGIGNNNNNSPTDESLQKLNFEVNDWESEKLQILKNWSEETEVLTLVSYFNYYHHNNNHNNTYSLFR